MDILCYHTTGILFIWKGSEQMTTPINKLTDDDLIAIRNVATDVRAISIINELVSLRHQLKDWKGIADKLALDIALDAGQNGNNYLFYQDLLKKYGEKDG